MSVPFIIDGNYSSEIQVGSYSEMTQEINYIYPEISQLLIVFTEHGYPIAVTTIDHTQHKNRGTLERFGYTELVLNGNGSVDEIYAFTDPEDYAYYTDVMAEIMKNFSIENIEHFQYLLQDLADELNELINEYTE